VIRVEKHILILEGISELFPSMASSSMLLFDRSLVHRSGSKRLLEINGAKALLGG